MSNELSADQITHVNYAFANVNSKTNKIILSNSYVDLKKHYSKNFWLKNKVNVHDNIKQLFLLKKKHRNLKILLFIKNWIYSLNVVKVIFTLAKKKRFAKLVVRLVKNLELDNNHVT